MPKQISLHKSSLCGQRESNEDVEEYLINLLQNGEPDNNEYSPVDVAIICDGHGGKSVAKFVAPLLKKYVAKKNLVYPLSEKYINNVYNFIQKKLINHEKRIADMCGTTALVVIRYFKDNKEHMQVINLGDCRAVLSKRSIYIPLTVDHKPAWANEKKRINKVNEKSVIKRNIEFDGDCWRIGDLSVSRSFGDLDNTPHVTHIPEIYNYVLDKSDQFIILACDGLWDVVNNNDAVCFVKDYLLYCKQNNNKINIARKLADYAISEGSTDNVSIIIIFFE